jgi:pimeloyl-ACP methyl ester carboxylesterase
VTNAACCRRRSYGSPSAAQINLAIIRIAAQKPSERVGVLFFADGGPGGGSHLGGASGIDARFSQDVRDRYDLIGFDPRGGGDSTQIDCVDNLSFQNALVPNPTPAQRQSMIAAASSFAAACQAHSGSLLQHVDTKTVARDMDLIRADLGEEEDLGLQPLVRHAHRARLR